VTRVAWVEKGVAVTLEQRLVHVHARTGLTDMGLGMKVA
jgi:hypothetical protein